MTQVAERVRESARSLRKMVLLSLSDRITKNQAKRADWPDDPVNYRAPRRAKDVFFIRGKSLLCKSGQIKMESVLEEVSRGGERQDHDARCFRVLTRATPV